MKGVELADHPIRVTAPGRVNLLGEHVDYNEGIVLPVAIDRYVRLAGVPRRDNWVSLTAKDLGQSVTFDLSNLQAKVDIHGDALPGWARYPAGVAWSLQEHGYSLKGFDGDFNSDIPIGAGLSSSAAVELAFAVMWRELGGWNASPLNLAQICQRAEVQYVGVNCGLMDQFASAHGVEGHALYFDTRSLEWHPVRLPSDTAIIIADSKIPHHLTSSAYNDRRSACEQAVSLLKARLPGMRALRDVTPAQLDEWGHLLPEEVQKRARHVVEECARVESARWMLEKGDVAGFGKLMFECHASLRDYYEVSTPELDALVEIARRLPGCWGARLTGAGFGGCTVNLVQADLANPFIQGVKRGYQQETGKKAKVYLCRASRGAGVIG
jgi:galactokinase